MIPGDYGELLEDRLKAAAITIPERSLLMPLARELLGMAHAYRSDGITFLRNGDPVNALAAFCYGLGWLDAGCGLGLLIPAAGCRYGLWEAEVFPGETSDQLREKTARYEILLARALGAVEPAPEQDSIASSISHRIRLIAAIHADEGHTAAFRGNLPRALALFSYGHGWLDAGVRAGLFRITGSREIFAL